MVLHSAILPPNLSSFFALFLERIHIFFELTKLQFLYCILPFSATFSTALTTQVTTLHIGLYTITKISMWSTTTFMKSINLVSCWTPTVTFFIPLNVCIWFAPKSSRIRSQSRHFKSPNSLPCAGEQTFDFFFLMTYLF